jgi:ribbon-helix-helix protein
MLERRLDMGARYCHGMHIICKYHCHPMAHEKRTARLTILVDPDKKAMFEQLCAAEDSTSSQVIRRLIRGYIEQRLGRPWRPGEKGLPKDWMQAHPKARTTRDESPE